MSLFEELERLNEGLTPEDLLKLDEKRGIAEQTARWERINSGQPSHSGELAGGPRMSGKGSWYSQLPQHGWVDREDRPGSNALGVPDDEQGIALPSRKTLGQWFDVTFPNGETHRLQQTDVGPAQWTGKGIDISAAAAHKAGFTPKDFPTGGGFTWSPAEGPPGPQTYDTEDRTAVGLGGSRAYPDPQATAFDPTGRKRMANGDQQGILGALGMQNQQPQGLLGALGDPETMSYIAMMLKGFNPYSNLDPNSMLSNAHTMAMRKQALMQQQAERATDNTRADKALELNQRKFEFDQMSDAVRAAKDQNLEPGTQEYKDFITNYYQKKTAVQHSLTPIRGEGGKLGTLDAAGNFKVIDTGDFKPEGPTTTRDLGTTIGVFDRGGNLISQTPKDIAGAAEQKVMGTKTGEAKVGLPQALQTADQTLKEIDEIISHPGRETGTGLSSKLDPRNYIPGTDAYNFAVRVKQVGGRAFLQAYETLKGTGQITEIEGAKATDAIARMDKAQSDDEFLTAMNDFKGVINSIKGNLRQKAGMPAEASPSGSGSGAPKRLRYDPQTGKMVEQ